MFTPAIILLMTVNTIAASAVVLVALQASLWEAPPSRAGGNAGAEHFFEPSVSAKFGKS